MNLALSYLIFPEDAPIWHQAGLEPTRATERRIPLLLLPALTEDSDEVLIFKSGRALTGQEFQSLKRSSWARIETDEPRRVLRALNLPADEVRSVLQSAHGDEEAQSAC